jgi:mono/diheme cytochrome c family protein
MRRILIALAALAIAGGAAFWALTAPKTLSAEDLPDHRGDAVHGRYVFHMAGCSSCHAAPGAKGEDKLQLAGGLEFKTPFGIFVAPNISPDPEAGIGGWSDLDFVNAVTRGVSPEGAHYYPALPYMSYQRMTLTDVLDLKAYLDTLPPVAEAAPGHDLPLPFRLRRGLGLWKLVFVDYAPFQPDPDADPQVNRGAYLVTGPGHCGECHTPRNLLGGPLGDWAYAGGPEPDGKGTVPNITPSADGIGGWTEGDIADALKLGLTPDFESFGGAMIAVQENMAELTEADRAAIALYLKSLPPKPNYLKQ